MLHRDQLSNNQIQKPLYLDSSESPDGVTGNVYALIDYAFATVAAALNSPDDWCEILILHTNTKYCRASKGPSARAITASCSRQFRWITAGHSSIYRIHMPLA